MQSKSLDHVRDFASRLVHILPLRMGGHMKRPRTCVCTIVASKLPLLQGVRSAETADYFLYTSGVVLLQGPTRCQATVSLVGVGEMAIDETRALSKTTSIQLATSPRRGDTFVGK